LGGFAVGVLAALGTDTDTTAAPLILPQTIAGTLDTTATTTGTKMLTPTDMVYTVTDDPSKSVVFTMSGPNFATSTGTLDLKNMSALAAGGSFLISAQYRLLAGGWTLPGPAMMVTVNGSGAIVAPPVLGPIGGILPVLAPLTDDPTQVRITLTGGGFNAPGTEVYLRTTSVSVMLTRGIVKIAPALWPTFVPAFVP